MFFRRKLFILGLTAVLFITGANNRVLAEPGDPWINEIHYDNAGADTNEGIEIAGLAGTDLSDWSLVLYNGNGGATYNTEFLTGLIPEQGGGYGAVFFPITGLQNGSPDGMALVGPGNVVIQFLSYEGSFSATDGPANGMTSIDIGVSEASSTPIGNSLQLTGTGATYEDFIWAEAMVSTPGAVNTGQTFSGSNSDTAPSISSTIPGDGASDVAVSAYIEITFSEDVALADGSWFDISCANGGAFTAAETGGPQTLTLHPDNDFAYNDTCTVTVIGSQVTDVDTDDPPDNMESDFIFTFTTASGSPLANLVINEIDYDQPGPDDSEFIEIMNTSSERINLGDFVVELVNGDNNSAYDTIDLPDIELLDGEYFVICANSANTPDCDLDVEPSTNLIQNGSQDAIAIVRGNTIIDAVSYEGDVPGYVEGSGVGLVDDSNVDFGGLSRIPDGIDTQQNQVDLSFRCITPGSENSGADSECELPTEEICGGPMTPIYDIQGAGDSSPIEGQDVATEGIVTAVFTGGDQLNGFYLQDDAGDGNSATSDGIFIYAPGSSVETGNQVRVRGMVTELSGLTQISEVTHLLSCEAGAGISPTAMALPVADYNEWEQKEGMLILIDQELTVSDNFSLGSKGELLLSVNGRLQAPTNVVEPGAAANALQDLNNRSSIQLDDGSNAENLQLLPPYLGTDYTLRVGDTIPSLIGVVGYASDAYKIHPTIPAEVSFTRANERPETPEEFGGRLKVASFNLLNYFTTIDTGEPICGPAMDQDCRGADSPEEFRRQRDKIISAILNLEADIIGLLEIENNESESLQDLINGLNNSAGAGTYDFIDAGYVGKHAIKVGIIYQPSRVTPIGSFAILDSSIDPTFNDDKNRPVLAQTFAENVTGEKLTIAVNHLKSKGSDCEDAGDPDTGDGQGNCNNTRTQAAQAEVNWLASDPTNSGDRDFMIIGDLNAYNKEDPIDAIVDSGYTNLGPSFQGDDSYSFVYFGQAGALDHALTSPNLTAQAAGATIWHINADEPPALDYNDFNQPELYKPDQYRASDHDSVVVELNLTSNVTNEAGCFIAILEGSPYTGAGTVVPSLLPQLGLFDALRWASAEGLPSDACYEIHGSNRADKIRGGDKADTIFGYEGDDGLLGRAGDDTFTGGLGADLFIGQSGHDTVLDIETGIDFCNSIETGCE